MVGHVKNYGVDEDSRVELYMPFLQDPGLASRSSSAPRAIRRRRDRGRARRPSARSIPTLPVFAVRHDRASSCPSGPRQRRLAVLLISVFAGVALLLAAVGIYGVMSYAVASARRRSASAWRWAPSASEILRMVLRYGTTMAASRRHRSRASSRLRLARLIASLLFQASAADPPTFSVVRSC